MSLNIPKYIVALLGTVITSYTATGQLQLNKPNLSATIPTVSNVYTPGGYSGTTPVNYVRIWQALGPYNDPAALMGASYQNVKQTTGYFDGLGRPLQTVMRQATPGTSPKDLVSPVHYDDFGREAYKFMPYVANASDGLLRTNPFVEQKNYLQNPAVFAGEQVFYSKANFEASPLNRVEKVVGPGNSWASSGKGVEQKYMVNTVPDYVVNWNITNNTLTWSGNEETINIPTTASGTYYTAGELFKNVILDEAGNAIVEYLDKAGKIILRKVQVGNIATDFSGYAGFLCTYYIYDDLDNLRFVIPPKAVTVIQPGWTFSGATSVINELCFRYEYDHRRRMIANKVPGTGWTYLVYDTRNRLVFSQDANLRSKDQWQTILYDALNRPVITGITTWVGTPAVLQTAVTAQTTAPIIPAGTPADISLPSGTYNDAHIATNSITIESDFIGNPGFSASILSEDGETVGMEGTTVNNYPIPQGAPFTALTITYYDNYDWTNKTYTTTYNGRLEDVYKDETKGINLHPEVLPAQASTQTLGLVTGTKVRVLKDPNNLPAGDWLSSVNFYDNKARVIQVLADNHTKGQDIAISRYDFTGKVLGTYMVHNNPDVVPAVTTKVKTIFKYDAGGRLLETWKILNDEDTKKTLIAANTYDELGQLKKKELGQQKDPSTGAYTSVPIETLDYSYNVRGWLKGINKDYVADAGTGNRKFGMELSYDWGFQTSQFNGNIAGVKWRSTGDGEKRSYGYSYDAANRLLGADFAQQSGASYVEHNVIKFDMQMGDGQNASTAYDENGNIKAMQQWGLKVNSSAMIDNMQYTYHSNSNKLRAVTETGTGTADHKLGDFTDKNTTTDDYGYDKNGNLITDLNKGITGSTGIDQTTGGAIAYNHLNLPWKITVKNDAGTAIKGTITYTYSAVGTKLQKQVEDLSVSGKTVTTTTDYLAGMVYESETTVGGTPPPGPADNYVAKLQFIGQEEGRIRYIPAEGTTPASFVYDYFVRDHLGNTRMVLTEERKQNIYPAATFEGNLTVDGVPNAVFKEKDFYNINSAYIVPKSEATGITDHRNKNGGPLTLDPPVNNNPNSDVTAISAKLYKLNASTNKTGLGITLKVMSGDQINIYGKSYWINTGGNFTDKNTLPVAGLLDALLGSPSMAGKGLVTATLNTTAFTDAITPFLNRTDDPGHPAPWAYINWIFLDEQFNYAGGGSDRVGASGTTKTHDNTTIPTIEAPKNGYLFVYCSNESNYPVFFDNLQVIHTAGPVLEETHYYPFGLTMAGLSSKGAGKLQNLYKYNGYEENKSFDINLYESFYRSHDPQLGRFWQIDPKPYESVSLYAAMNNNPINFSDPLGDTIIFTQAFLATKYGQQLMALYKKSASFKKLLSKYDIGGKDGLWGKGAKGEFADNTNVVFDVYDDTNKNGDSPTGGGTASMQVQNDKGEWVDADVATSDGLSKDSKARINILVNPNSSETSSLQTFANVVTHELTVHGTGFMDMANILHSSSPSDFIKYRNAGNNVYFSTAASKNNIEYNGYYNRWVQHGAVGLGLMGYYNSIRKQLNATLSKQGKSLLPDDAKHYHEEVDRVIKAFKNINQITQLGVYGP